MSDIFTPFSNACRMEDRRLERRTCPTFAGRLVTLLVTGWLMSSVTKRCECRRFVATSFFLVNGCAYSRSLWPSPPPCVVDADIIFLSCFFFFFLFSSPNPGRRKGINKNKNKMTPFSGDVRVNTCRTDLVLCCSLGSLRWTAPISLDRVIVNAIKQGVGILSTNGSSLRQPTTCSAIERQRLGCCVLLQSHFEPGATQQINYAWRRD